MNEVIDRERSNLDQGCSETEELIPIDDNANPFERLRYDTIPSNLQSGLHKFYTAYTLFDS